jgi:hypothetical protein
MSDEGYPADPIDDPSSGMGFGAPASSGAASSTGKIRLEAISLQDLLDKHKSYLWTCYFLVAEKRDGSRPDLPVVIGVFRVNGVPNIGDPGLQKPLGGLSLGRIAQLLSLFTFELVQEDAAASNSLGTYSINLQYSPVTGKDTGPNGGKVDSPHGDSSLLDVAFLLQNFQITVSPVSSAGGPYGPYQTTGGSTNLGHANVELGLPHGPMALDCVASLLSLLDWTVGKDGVKAFVGGKMTVCYTNKSHTG